MSQKLENAKRLWSIGMSEDFQFVSRFNVYIQSSFYETIIV